MRIRTISTGWRCLPVLLLLLFVVTACEKSGTGGPTAAEKIAEGWTAFEAGDLSTAVSSFSEAVGISPVNAEAHHGLGWSRLMRGELSQAQSSFNSANNYGLAGVDADAGLAFVCRDLPDFSQAITSARAVLTASASWSFSHRTSVDWHDLRLVIAQCSYRLGEATFDDAQAELDLLDPDNGLDDAVPGTWVVGGVTYDTYAEALLMAIEAVEAAIGG